MLFVFYNTFSMFLSKMHFQMKENFRHLFPSFKIYSTVAILAFKLSQYSKHDSNSM